MKNLKVIAVIALASASIAGLSVRAEAAPQRKVVISDCTNKADPSDSIEIVVSIVMAPKRINETVISAFDREFHSNGEYDPAGPMMNGGADEHGHWVTIEASWPLLKTGAGELTTHPFEKEEATYRCRIVGFQG